MNEKVEDAQSLVAVAAMIDCRPELRNSQATGRVGNKIMHTFAMHATWSVGSETMTGGVASYMCAYNIIEKGRCAGFVFNEV